MIDPPQLRRSDIAILAACWLSVSLPAVLHPHTPVGQEAAIVQAARDLSAGSGCSASSEVPRWLATLAGLFVGVEAEVLALRSLAICAGLVTVLLSGGLAARWFGRQTGLIAGLVAATSAGLSAAVWHSGVAIWLAAATLVTFRLYSEVAFPAESAEQSGQSRRSLTRTRSLRIAGVVSWLGFIAILVGPAEAGIVIALPLGTYLYRQRREATIEILRSPGWLVIVAAVLLGHFPTWPTQLTMAGLADSVAGWATGLADGGTRLDRLGELGRTVMPWGILVPFGLWLTRHEALAIRYSRERLLLCATLAAPLASVLLFPARPNLVPAACSLWSLPAAVALNRIWQAATTSELQRRATLIPAARIGFAAATVLCVLSGLVGEWSRPELLDDDFLGRVAAMRTAAERLEIDVDARDRVRVVSRLGNSAALVSAAGEVTSAAQREANTRLRILVVSSPGRITDSTGRRAYRKLLESQHRAGQEDCLTLYETEASEIAARPREIR
jgi:hypothetical protein